MYLLLASPLFIPICFYLTARWMAPRLWPVHLLAPALGGGLAGAFLLSAASAMQSAVSPTSAIIRGSLGGSLVGAAVGLVGMGVFWVLGLLRGRGTPTGPSPQP